MKEVIWTFPYWIDHFPGLEALAYKTKHFSILIGMYLLIWAIVAKVLYIPKLNGQPMLEGFLISTIFMISYYYILSLPYTLSFDKPQKQLVLSRNGGTDKGGGQSYRVLYKSPWQQDYAKGGKKIGEKVEYYRKGVVVDAAIYRKYKKEGKIDDATLEDLASRKRHLKGEDKVEANTPFDIMVSVSFYLLIVLYSAAIIIAKVNKKMFDLLFPWIILSTLFLLIQSATWFANPTLQASVNTFFIKRQLFILGLSFSLTGILIVLKFNNK